MDQDLFWPLYACIFAAIFLIPWCLYFYHASKELRHKYEKSFLELASQKEKTFQEFAYNAIGYAVEQRGKARKQGNEIDVKTVAISHIKRRMDITDTEATDAIESVLGKVPGHGASGKDKVQR